MGVTVSGGGGGATSTELLALIASQVNVSSIGDTYTDTAGDTYAETVSQTRLTMSAARVRSVALAVSGRVGAGTGTFQLWNFTDSASLTTQTTTSTSEALITVANSAVATNNGDAITIRVKNSGAGGTTTIDGGGMMDKDTAAAAITATTAASATGTTIIPATSVSGYASSYSFALIKRPSTATITLEVQVNAILPDSNYQRMVTYGAAFGTSEANTVVSRTPTVKIGVWVTGLVNIVCSAISASASWVVGSSYELKADDL